MARLIDANALAMDYCEGDEKFNEEPWILSDILGFLNDAHTVDAVEVVRCKDCKFFDPNEDVMPQSGTCAYHEMIKMDWDFCSRAKMDGDGNG